MKNVFELPALSCPACLQRQDCLHCHGDDAREPQPGDWAICMSCASVNRLTEERTLRVAMASEWHELDVMQQFEVTKTVRAVWERNARRQGEN